jgi:hypothetical protein
MNGTVIDTPAQPEWRRTGYQFFPYAAALSGQWWVLRLNHGFPEHDMYTVFIDGVPAADITANTDDPSPWPPAWQRCSRMTPAPASRSWTPRPPPRWCTQCRATSTTAASTTTRASSAPRTMTRWRASRLRRSSRPTREHRELVAGWRALIEKHGVSPHAAEIGADLQAACDQPHRRYHTITHLRDVLARVDHLAANALDPDAVRPATWYHDSV